MQFSTKDADNDDDANVHCAVTRKGAWWHSKCGFANLNALYHGGRYSNLVGDGMKWVSFRGRYYSLKRTEIKLRPKP